MINYEGIVFTKEDCDDIKTNASEWKEAKLLVKRGLGEVEDIVIQNKRYNKASYFKLKKDSPHYKKLNGAVNKFGYEFIAEELDAGILKYEEGNFIFLHNDLPIEGEKRFFCIVIQLSDDNEYVGGNFRYLIDNEPHIMNRSIGNAIMFKPEILHEVTIVESGIRHSLVIWVNYEQVKSLSKPSLI